MSLGMLNQEHRYRGAVDRRYVCAGFRIKSQSKMSPRVSSYIAHMQRSLAPMLPIYSFKVNLIAPIYALPKMNRPPNPTACYPLPLRTPSQDPLPTQALESARDPLLLYQPRFHVANPSLA